MDKNRIEKGLYWDEAWSLVSGCTPVSEGCQNCWSARETHMRAEHPNDKVRARNKGLTEAGQFNGRVRLNYEFLGKPLRKKKPTVYAVWNDLFHEDVPDEFIARIWWVMGQCAGYLDPTRYRGHTFLILTKRPERMQKWLNGWSDGETRRQWIESFGEVYDWMSGPKYWPDVLPNVWLGVTAENQQRADERIPILLQIPAAVRFVSVEPMLGPVDLASTGALGCTCPPLEGDDGQIEERCSGQCVFYKNAVDKMKRINWVICGGETGPGARPMHPDWVRSLRDQCQDSGVPFFFKQHGEWLHETQGINFHEGHRYYVWPDESMSFRVGKKAAGRILDGQIWDEMPEI